MSLESHINKRKTFAIISHPDAGKTTITEKMLLFGNLIQLAGTVKGKNQVGMLLLIGWRWKSSAVSPLQPL